MRYESNRFIRTMLALMLALVLGGGMSLAMADHHGDGKQKDKEEEEEQKQSDQEGDDGGYGDFDPTESFGSALGGDSEDEEEE